MKWRAPLERFALITTAIAREKQLKNWSRIKKLRLIVAANPTWHDLSEDFANPYCVVPPRNTVSAFPPTTR